MKALVSVLLSGTQNNLTNCITTFHCRSTIVVDAARVVSGIPTDTERDKVLEILGTWNKTGHTPGSEHTKWQEKTFPSYGKGTSTQCTNRSLARGFTYVFLIGRQQCQTDSNSISTWAEYLTALIATDKKTLLSVFTECVPSTSLSGWKATLERYMYFLL